MTIYSEILYFLESEICFVDFKALGGNLKLYVLVHPCLCLVSSAVLCPLPGKWVGCAAGTAPQRSLPVRCTAVFILTSPQSLHLILIPTDLGNREELTAFEFRVMACVSNFKTTHLLL